MAGDRTRIGLWTPQVGIAQGRGGVHVHYAMHIAEADFDAAVDRCAGMVMTRKWTSSRRPTAARRTSPTRTATSSSSGRTRAASTGADVNRLAEQASPYLLQHADNPVDWYPWGDEAFERRAPRTSRCCSRSATRPATGATSWSTSRSRTTRSAALMNEHFVNIKVDREERPDVDALYMDAVVALTGHGGWPMTVFLTPEGEPFFGRHVLPAGAAARAAELPAAARGRLGRLPGQPRRRQPQAEGARRRRRRLERRRPRATRSPRACSARPRVRSGRSSTSSGRLRRRAEVPAQPRRSSSCSACTCAATRTPCRWWSATLDAMAAGGMYDLVGGGFHRYSVDPAWLVAALREDALRQRAARRDLPPRLGRDGERALSRRRRGDPRVHAARARACRRAASPRRRTRTPTGVEGLTFTWTPEEGVPEELLQPFEDGRFDHPRPARPTRCALGSSSCASSGRSPRGTTRRSRPGTGSRSRRSPRQAGGSSATTSSTRPRGSASSCSGRSRTSEGRLHRTFRAGRAKGNRLPRGLRGRRERPARAARRHGRAALARGGEPTRAARGRAVRRRGARRLLSLARRRRGARRAQEGPRGPADALGQRDAGLRPAEAGADLRRRRARARGRRGLPARPPRDRLGSPPRSAMRSPRSTSTSRRRGSSRSSARPDSPVARAALEPFEPEHGRRRRPGGRGPAARGQGAGRRQAGGLRLRALRLPGSGHRPGSRATAVRTLSQRLYKALTTPGRRLTPMAVSNRWTLMAALAAGIAAAAGLGFERRPERVACDPPERRRADDRRPDARVDAGDAERSRPCSPTRASPSRTTSSRIPLCCPSRATFLTGQYAHNHGVMGQRRAERRLLEARQHEHAARLAPARRLPDGPPRQVPERLRHAGRATEIPPGWGEWYGSVDPSTYRFYNYTLNENGKIVRYGTDAANYQADVYARKAVDIIVRQAVDPRPFFLSRRLPRPAQRRAARPRRPAQPGHPVAGAAAPQPLRDAAAPRPALLQRGRRLRQAGRHPQRGR